MSAARRRALWLGFGFGFGFGFGLAAQAHAQMAPGPLGRMRFCDLKVAISQTASAQIVAGAAGSKVHVCAIVLVTAADQSISLVEGTGSVCATSTAGVLGGSTASVSLVSQGGLSAIAPYAWLTTATAGNNLCLLQSASGNVSGVITYRIAP